MLNKYILNENMELHLFNRKLTRKIQLFFVFVELY